MLKVGDVVVTMSYPGLFTIVEIIGDDVRIADARRDASGPCAHPTYGASIGKDAPQAMSAGA